MTHKVGRAGRIKNLGVWEFVEPHKRTGLASGQLNNGMGWVTDCKTIYLIICGINWAGITFTKRYVVNERGRVIQGRNKTATAGNGWL